jgi:hypothetical protein
MALLDISVDTANKLYAWGWYGSIVGATITAVAVLSLMWGTRVRDRDFETQVANLNSATAQSRERAANLEVRAGELEKANLELSTTLERERTARARIEAGLASRHVRQEQKAALVAALNGLNIAVVVSTYNNPEASAYADEVISALKEAGVTVNEGSQIMTGGGNLAGLLVEETADIRLINALFLAGLATQKMQSTKNPMLRTGEGLNAILVGLKPNPF